MKSLRGASTFKLQTQIAELQQELHDAEHAKSSAFAEVDRLENLVKSLETEALGLHARVNRLQNLLAAEKQWVEDLKEDYIRYGEAL